MTEDEIKERIIEIINSTEEYITADQIYEQLKSAVGPGRTQEEVRGFIRELVNEQNHLIGSSNKGFFPINTAIKAKEAISYLVSRIPDLQKRADKIRKNWNDSHPDDQI